MQEGIIAVILNSQAGDCTSEVVYQRHEARDLKEVPVMPDKRVDQRRLKKDVMPLDRKQGN